MIIVTVSQVFIVAIGAIVAALCLWGLAVPGKLLALARGAMAQPWGMVLAVGGRLLIGAALIIAAPQARFPVIFGYLGWIAITAAAVLVFVGRERIQRLIGWFEQQSGILVRVWLAFGFLFGAFLVYAVLAPPAY